MYVPSRTSHSYIPEEPAFSSANARPRHPDTTQSRMPLSSTHIEYDVRSAASTRTLFLARPVHAVCAHLRLRRPPSPLLYLPRHNAFLADPTNEPDALHEPWTYLYPYPKRAASLSHGLVLHFRFRQLLRPESPYRVGLLCSAHAQTGTYIHRIGPKYRSSIRRRWIWMNRLAYPDLRASTVHASSLGATPSIPPRACKICDIICDVRYDAHLLGSYGVRPSSPCCADAPMRWCAAWSSGHRNNAQTALPAVVPTALSTDHGEDTRFLDACTAHAKHASTRHDASVATVQCAPPTTG
ncbi:hypothetical protein C8R45DRAFT_1095867 [Mycena sanguinolenta]|nr:hypothetical protein C8R45DRAFT_1095867 [Mycena sanguinolenta]